MSSLIRPFFALDGLASAALEVDFIGFRVPTVPTQGNG